MKSNKIYLFHIHFSILLLIGATTETLAQKVKIVLIGTLHLTPSEQDLYKNKKIDLSTPKKQREIQEVVDKIAAFEPDQIFLEYPIEDQSEMDSIFTAYKAGKYKLRDNERDLFGMQAVKKLGLASPTCINYSLGRFDFDPVSNFALQHNQKETISSFQKQATAFLQEADSKLTELSLKDFLVFVNSKEMLQKNLELYLKHLVKIGSDTNYVGSDLVADWYSTNIHIYTNILRSIKPIDKNIVVLFGQGHIPILKHLCMNNPDFEVVEVKDVLK